VNGLLGSPRPAARGPQVYCYAVVFQKTGEVVAVKMTRQAAREGFGELLEKYSPKDLRVRRAKLTLFER
jgi:hypothetical protein